MRIGTRVIFTYDGKKHVGTVCTYEEVQEQQTMNVLRDKQVYVRFPTPILSDGEQTCHSCWHEWVVAEQVMRIEGNELILEES